MINLKVNGKAYQVDVDPSTPIFWVIRDNLGLTGTKFGCGAAQCGACMVHLDGDGIRSCIAPVSRADGKEMVTIEGLGSKAEQAPAAGLDTGRCAAMRILSVGADHGGSYTNKRQPQSNRWRY